MPFEIINSLAITIAAIITIYGINSWQREARWKTRYEVAEEVLSAAYGVKDAFAYIRSPFGVGGEGKSREKREGETADEARAYDSAYIVVERYEEVKEPFQKLQALKYRFMVFYGKDTKMAFDQINILKNKVFSASYRINTRHLRYPRATPPPLLSEDNIKEIERLDGILYSDIGEDSFGEQVDSAISKIESFCANVIRKDK